MVRKSHPLTRIDRKIQQLKVFQYITELYTRMGYYTTKLYLKSRYMPTIVTTVGNLRHNQLLMDMWTFGDILKNKVGKILGDIECINTYNMSSGIKVTGSASAWYDQNMWFPDFQTLLAAKNDHNLQLENYGVRWWWCKHFSRLLITYILYHILPEGEIYPNFKLF